MKHILGVVLSVLLATPGMCTTIAWSGTEIACDNQSTSGHTKFKSAHPKIIRSEKRHACMACAGAVTITTNLKKYFLETDKPLSEYQLPEIVSKQEGLFAALVINDDGTAWYYSHSMIDPEPVTAPFTFGTGEDFALAILADGGSAKHAIEVAEDLDLYTGGKIHVLQAPQPESITADKKK